MKKLLALVLAMLMVLSLLTGCGSKTTTTTTTEPAKEETSILEEAVSTVDSVLTNAEMAAVAEEALRAGKTPVCTELKFGAPGPIGTYLFSNSATTMEQLIWLVFDPIIYTDPLTLEFTSDICDFEYADEKTLVLKVKEGVTFTDGSTLTGEDVLFTCASMVSPDRAATYGSKFAIFNFDKSYVGDDGMTVYLITDNVEAAALTNLNVPVYSKAWVEANGWDGEAWYYEPNGTGPYVVASNDVGLTSTCTLKEEVKNGTYWNKDYITGIETVTGTHYDDKNVMFIDAQNGDIDMAFQVNCADYARISSENLEDLTGVLVPYDDVQLLAFDINEGAGVDENLRAAVAYGVDWSDVALAAWEDYGAPATSILASTLTEYYSNVGGYEYDYDLAKSYADKITGSKELLINIFSDDLYVKECEVIRAYLEPLGITLTVDVTDMATYFGGLMSGYGDCGFFRYPNGNYSHEPTLALSGFERESTVANQNLKADDYICDLLASAHQTVDVTERAKLYKEVQEYFKEHFYAIPIAENYGSYVFNNTRWAGAAIIANNAPNLRYVYQLFQ